MQIWVLTFDRPVALNRLIKNFKDQGHMVNIFNNHPNLNIAESNWGAVNRIVQNTLTTAESNSWCARSWNSILLQAFDKEDDDEIVLIQDDTNISNTFTPWINEQKQKFDFIWGPAGDQFHFIRKDVVRATGWWDERFVGCYCGDAEYLKRVYMAYDRERLSIIDSHNWGFVHNDCGLTSQVITTYQSKTVDPDYDNQHWEFERVHGCGPFSSTAETNPTIKAAQAHFQAKWGVDLDNGQPVINSLVRQQPEIDWYPWATKKFGIKNV